MTTLRFHRLSVRRFTRTLTNYIFSESLMIEDRDNVFKKYIVHKIGSAPVENDLERKTNIAPTSSHLCLKNRVSEVLYLAWFIFCTQLNFEVQRNTSPLSFKDHNF